MIDVAGPVDVLSSSSKAVYAPYEAAGLVPAGFSDKAIEYNIFSYKILLGARASELRQEPIQLLCSAIGSLYCCLNS